MSSTLRGNKIKILETFNRLAPDIRRFVRDKFWNPPQMLSDIIKERVSTDSTFSEYKDVIVSGETENTSIYIVGNEDIMVYTPFQHIKENKVLLMRPKTLAKHDDHISL